MQAKHLRADAFAAHTLNLIYPKRHDDYGTSCNTGYKTLVGVGGGGGGGCLEEVLVSHFPINACDSRTFYRVMHTKLTQTSGTYSI